MRKSIFIILLSFLLSCSHNSSIQGVYKSDDVSILERPILWLKGIDSWALGTTLTLNLDSTYEMETCGAIIQGVWNRKNDSLLLNITFFKYKKPEFYENKPEFSQKEPTVFIIEDNKLVSHFTTSTNRKIMNRLVKQSQD